MTSNEVALAFEDGVIRMIRVGRFETIMDAAYKARINIPSDCRDGACGTCKSLCISGEFDPGDFIDDAMTEDELDRGYLLTCQAEPETDMVIEVPGTSEMAKTSAAQFQATITELIHHSDSTVSFSLDVQDRDDLAFLPGQYMNVQVPGTDQQRSYSFSSGTKDDHASFMVRITPEGAMSTYLAQRAKVGDELTMTGPFGSFFLRAPQRRMLLLAGGTGLAPILSMLEKMVTDNVTQPAHLIYGVTNDIDVVGRDLLDAYVEKLPNFSYTYCVSSPETTHENTGYVTAYIQNEHLDDGDVDVYLCGPPAMVNAVEGWFTDQRITPANFYFERFAPKATTDGDEETGAPVSTQMLAEAGEQISAAQAVSTIETGRLSFRTEDSMAHLDARMGLELAVSELMIGNLSAEQLKRFRRLAEQIQEHLSAAGDAVVDVDGFIRSNDAFHEYLFSLCDNPTFFDSYRRLDVSAQMGEALADSCWLAPEITQEHFDLVDALEREDLAAVRQIILSHNDFCRHTMRTAIEQEVAA